MQLWLCTCEFGRAQQCFHYDLFAFGRKVLSLMKQPLHLFISEMMIRLKCSSKSYKRPLLIQRLTTRRRKHKQNKQQSRLSWSHMVSFVLLNALTILAARIMTVVPHNKIAFVKLKPLIGQPVLYNTQTIQYTLLPFFSTSEYFVAPVILNPVV